MRVLLVEDNPDDEELTRLALEARLGGEMESVGDGVAALERLARDPLPDLVLLDVNLPRLGGAEVLDRLRADPRTAGLPVLVMLSSPEDPLRARVDGMEATRWLTKPVGWASFAAACRELGLASV